MAEADELETFFRIQPRYLDCRAIFHRPTENPIDFIKHGEKKQKIWNATSDNNKILDFNKSKCWVGNCNIRATIRPRKAKEYELLKGNYGWSDSICGFFDWGCSRWWLEVEAVSFSHVFKSFFHSLKIAVKLSLNKQNFEVRIAVVSNLSRFEFDVTAQTVIKNFFR